MELLYPSVGIMFWTVLAFGIVFFILSKFAWKPIVQSLRQREDYIANSLTKAKEVEENVKKIREENERLLAEASEERKSLLAEAKQIYDKAIADAKTDAKKEAECIMREGMDTVRREQEKAMASAKNELADLVLSVVEKVLQEKMKGKAENKKLVQKLIKQLP